MEEIGFIIKLKDQASAGVKQLAAGFNLLGMKITEIGRRARKADQATDSWLSGIAKKSQRAAAAFSSVSLALNDASHQLARITSMTVGVVFSMAQAGIMAATQIEVSNARLDFAVGKLGKSAEETKERINDVSLATVLTRKEVTDMVTGLALQKIDAFDSSLDDLFVTMQDGSRVGVTSLEVMNDAVAFSGKNAARIMRGVREAVSERKIRTGRWLSEDLEIGGKELAKWNAALKQATGPQEAFNALLGLMAERVGGLTKSMDQTLDFALKKIGDWQDKLADELFRDALPIITKFINDAGNSFIELTREDYFAPIRESITRTIKGIAELAGWLMVGGRAVMDFVRAFPWVIPLLTALGGVMTALTGIAIVISGLLAPVLAFGALAALLPTIIVGLKVGLVIMAKLALVGSLVAAPLLLIVGAVGALAAAYVRAEGVVDFFERWGQVIAAVFEGIQNLDGSFTRLSTETAAGLEKSGLMDQVIDILQIYVKLKNAAIAFKDQMVANWPQIVEAMRPAIESFQSLFSMVGVALDLAPADDDLEGWEKWGKVIANVVSGVAVLFTRLVNQVFVMMNSLAKRMLQFGVLDMDEYARAMGAPPEFFKLDKSRRSELVNDATFTDEGFVTGGFNAGADDKTYTDPDNLPQEFKALGGPALAWARGLQRQNQLDADDIVRKMAGNEIPVDRAPMSLEALYANLGQTQRGVVDQAVSDGTIDDKDYSLLARLIGEEFAKRLRESPMTFNLDQAALAESVAQGALVSVEDGGS